MLASQVGVLALALAVGVLPGGCRALALPWQGKHVGPKTEQVGTKQLVALQLLGVTVLAWLMLV